jgi:hypothetical protein
MIKRPRRRPAARDVVLVTDAGRLTVHLIDASHGGVKLALRETLRPGDPVAVSTPEATYPGMVRWCRDIRIGVRFDTPLTEQELCHLVGLRTGRAANAMRRYFFNAASLR